MEEGILAEAMEDATKRIAALEDQLHSLQAGTSSLAFAEELHYLETLIKKPALPQAMCEELDMRLKALRRVDMQIRSADEKEEAEIRSGLQSLPIAEASSNLASPSGYAAERNREAPDLTSTKDSLTSRVTSFFRFSKTDFSQEDQVRLLAADGQLAEEVSKYPSVSVPEIGASLLMRQSDSQQSTFEMRQWTSEDDEEEERRLCEQLREVERLAQGSQELQEMVWDQVEEQQTMLDGTEERVQQARANTETAVQFLERAEKAWDKRNTLVISTSILSLCALGGPKGIGAGLVIGGAAALTKKLRERGAIDDGRDGSLLWMVDHLPKAVSPMMPEHIEMFRVAGDETERRLVTKLRHENTWTPVSSLTGWRHGVTFSCCESGLAQGGNAYSCSFTMAVPAAHIFQHIQQLCLKGSLDPDCRMSWSRPVDGVPNTSIRYSVISHNPKVTHDFYCVCRSGQAKQTDVAEQREAYVWAVSSMSSDMRELSGLPKRIEGVDEHMQQGHIHAAGILVTDMGQGTSKVEIMADIDVGIKTGHDSLVRMHVKKIARALQSEAEVHSKLGTDGSTRTMKSPNFRTSATTT